MADVTRTKANVRPLQGAVCRNATAGEEIELGEIVAMSSTGSTVELASAGVGGNAAVVGVVVAVGAQGKDTAAAGDAVSVLLWGPVQGWSGMTPGAVHYLSDTEGALSTTAGTTSLVMGVAWDADVFLFLPNLSPAA